MKQNSTYGIFILVRNFFFRLVNKEFLIFLFFLALSGAFWLLLALNDTYEKELRIPIRIVNIPKNVVPISNVNDTLKVTVRDKGYTLCAYLYGEKIKTINIPFASYIKYNGVGNVTSAELSKLVYMELFSSSRIISVKPDRYEYFFNYGKHKRIPVRLSGEIMPEASYYIAKIEFSPKAVDVYGSTKLLDSIKSIYTERINIHNLRDTIVKKLNLRSIKGVKFVPSSVKVSVYPDVLTEESVEVPITALNMPEGKILRTFPSRVKVTFTVGASIFRSIQIDRFKVVVDYNELMAAPAEKCNVKIASVPHGVKNARIEQPQVDYLIEEQ